MIRVIIDGARSVVIVSAQVVVLDGFLNEGDYTLLPGATKKSNCQKFTWKRKLNLRDEKYLFASYLYHMISSVTNAIL